MSEQFVDQIISNALNTANSAVNSASNAARDAVNAGRGTQIARPTFTYGTITATEPGRATADRFGQLVIGADPWADLSTENSSLTFEAQRDKIIALLSDELAGFFAKYYPLAADAFDEATNWLVNSITSGGTGISAAVEDQIWQRGRDRITADGMRTESQTLNEFASRGFSLPPGAMAARLQENRFAQLGKTQELSRDAAIKQADMAVENLRFAVGLAIESRMKAMQAAADYIRSLMSGVDSAAKVASINSDAKAKMMSASADMYRARLTRDQLSIQAGSTNAQLFTQASIASLDGFYKGGSNAVAGAAAAAEVYGGMAKAALSSLTAVAGSTISSFG